MSTQFVVQILNTSIKSLNKKLKKVYVYSIFQHFIKKINTIIQIFSKSNEIPNKIIEMLDKTINIQMHN